MADDLDFDSLLADLDKPTTPTEEIVEEVVEVVEEEVVEEVVEKPNLTKELEELRNENAKLKTENDELSKTNATISEAILRVEDGRDVQGAQDIQSVQSEPEAISEAEQFFLDNVDVYKSYIRKIFEHKAEMKQLKDDFKAEKEAFKEKGISITSVNRAIRNIKEQIKENSEDAQAVIGTERLILNDADFMAEITAQVN